VTLLFGAAISQEDLQEQRFYPEAPIEFRDGALYSVQITVGFASHLVIENLEGNERLNGNQIQEGPFRNRLANFCAERNVAMEDIFIKRGVPSWPLAKSTITNMITGEVKPAIDLSLVHIIRFPQMVNVEALCESLKKTEGIAYAHPPVLIGLLTEPNDTFYSKQWYLQKIQAPKAWDISKGIDTIRIAIIDPQAVCQTHPDLNPPSEGKIAGGDSATETIGDEWHRHGTMVAGVAAAVTNNSLGIAGLGWNNQIITYETPTGKDTDDSLLAEKINAAAQPSNKVQVINLSFHIGEPTYDHYSWCDRPMLPYSTRIIQEGPDGDFPEIEGAISNAIGSGIVVVAAGGNTQREFYCGGEYSPPAELYCKKGEDNRYGPIWPAAYPGVIGVSGTDSADALASSYDPILGETASYNYGSHIDVCAPAKNIKSTQPPDGYYTDNGTSLSAPLVAAEAALIRSVNSDLIVSEVESIIEQSADKVAGMGGAPRTDEYGYGRINVYQALLLALAYDNKSQSPTATAYNSGRRLVRDSSGNYHLVFESGGEIFYRKQVGNNWQVPIRLSNGNDGNRYPSIAGTSSKQFVVWQRYAGIVNGKHRYEIWLAKNLGSSWSTSYTNYICGFCHANRSPANADVQAEQRFAHSFSLQRRHSHSLFY